MHPFAFWQARTQPDAFIQRRPKLDIASATEEILLCKIFRGSTPIYSAFRGLRGSEPPLALYADHAELQLSANLRVNFAKAKFLGVRASLHYTQKKRRKRCFLLFFWSGLRGSNPPPSPWQGDALPNELNPHLWCLRSESNQRHGDFQSPALPTELQRHKQQGLLI